ncbi:MAG: hypothetical protein H5T84_09710, partial [Thermoleophilia bacterium]|nr:hypothetical protein [Thermoleophilia bacterium]
MPSQDDKTGQPFPSNTQLAEVFQTLADYLALDGESQYRILAYEKAAALFRDFPVSVAEMALRGKLRTLPGVGEAIESKVLEYVSTGDLTLLHNLRSRYPEGLLTLMRLPGVGPKTARRLWEALGIADIPSLRQACQEGRIRVLPGMGEKTEAKLLRAIATWEARQREAVHPRRLLGVVEPQAARLVEALRLLPGVTAADYAGSLRRHRATVRDIDLVAASDTHRAVMDAFASLPEIATVHERGETKLTAVTHAGLNVDLRVVPPASYGNLLQHFTGSAEHNVALRAYAQQQGYKISEYHVEELATGRKITCATEAEVYGLLGLAYIPPELRENEGEIEAAANGVLPQLVTLADLQGDLHVHSDWTDGRAGLADMALAAQARGLKYICFCDHSQSLAMTGGLGPERVLAQIAAIRDLDSR